MAAGGPSRETAAGLFLALTRASGRQDLDLGRVQVPEAEGRPPGRGWRRPIPARFLWAVTVHPPGRQPERRAGVRARVSPRFPAGALQPSRYGADTLGWSASGAKAS